MARFKVKNFEKFQHYKDRSPPWIKLYNDVLEDYAFGSLPDASKAHLLAIWLLASRTGNELPFDPDWIAKRINATEPVNLRLLADAGFILVDQPLPQPEQVASNTLQAAEQVAIPEREGETEERERESRGEIGGAVAPDPDLDPPIPLDRICQTAMARWNEMATAAGLPEAQRLTDARRKALRARLAECGGLAGWDTALGKVRDSPFLRGQNDKGWRADFDFVLQAKSFTRLMEGAYDNRTGQGRASSAAAAVAGILGAAD